jgi:UDP-N-acetylenolpyruvoylglucosamine reductase
MSQINNLNFNQERNFDLSKISPLKIQKIAKTVYIPKDVKECEKLIRYLISQKKNYYILGNISNSIICPDDKDKITIPIILTKNLNQFSVDTKNKKAAAECGVLLSKFSRNISNECFAGFSGLMGFPATIGGAIFMNAGSYGQEISDFLESVDCINNKGELVNLKKEELKFKWRISNFQNIYKNYFILKAYFNLVAYDKEKILLHQNFCKNHRIIFQEKGGTNLGSTFATKWIYSDIQSKKISFIVIRKFFNIFFKITLFLRMYFIIPFLTKHFIQYCLNYFNFKIPKGINISNKSLNCIVVEYSNTNLEEYVNFIKQYKKLLNPKSELEIQILNEKENWNNNLS